MRALPLLLLLATAACGPREPGFKPGEILFWNITATSVEFGQCSDAPSWRDQFTAPEPSESSFIAIGVDDDGKTAHLLSCSSLSAGSCAIADPPITFTVAGSELVFGQNSRGTINGSTCGLAVAETLLLEDLGTTMRLSDTLLFTLVDDAVACGEFEANIKAQSANQLGIEGCGVTTLFEGKLR